MDLKTLWGRTNDAIDTIIRKDDANESGDLLQPCIEGIIHSYSYENGKTAYFLQE